MMIVMIMMMVTMIMGILDYTIDNDYGGVNSY